MNKRSGFSVLALLGVVLVLALIPQADAVINNPFDFIQENKVCNLNNLNNSDEQPESVVVQNGKTYVIWRNADATTPEGNCTNGDLRFSVSDSGGAWSTPIIIGGVSITTQGIQAHGLKATGDVLDVVYLDRYAGTGEEKLLHVRSINAGATWTSEHLIHDFSATNELTGGEMDFDVDGNTIVVVWNNRIGDATTVATSTNSGVAWSEVEIDDGNGGVGRVIGSDVHRPSISVEGTSVIVALGAREDDGQNDRQLWLTNSTDTGATFHSPLVLVTSQTVSGGLQFPPHIYRDGSEVSIIFGLEVETDIVRSSDGGVTFGSDFEIFDSVSDCDRGNETAFHQSPTNANEFYMACIGVDEDDVMFSTSTDNGDTWTTTKSVTQIPAIETNQMSITNYDSDVWITWESQDIFGDRHLYLVRSNDKGLSFVQEEVFYDYYDSQGGSTPNLKTDGSHLSLIVESDEFDITGDLYSYYENLSTPATPIVPTLSISPVQVSDSGGGDNGVTNVINYESDDGVYWTWNENLGSELWFSYSEMGEMNNPIKIFQNAGSETLKSNPQTGGYSNVFADGDDVFVFYVIEDAILDDDIRLKRSTNGGETFGSEILVRDGYHFRPSSDFDHSGAFMVKSNDGDLFMFMISGDILVNGVTMRSTDNGDTWVNQGVFDFANGGGGEVSDPLINRDSFVVDGDTIHVVTGSTDDVSGDYSYHYSRSTNEGVTWINHIDLTDTSIDMYEGDPHLIKDGDDLFVWWIDYENDGNFQYNYSDDNGSTWCEEDALCDEILSNDPSACNYEFDDYAVEHLEGTSDIVMVCGSRVAENPNVTYMTVSNDMGVNWSSLDILDSSDMFGFEGSNILVRGSSSGANMAFSWYYKDAEQPDNFVINEVRATLPNDISDFSSIVTHYENQFAVWGTYQNDYEHHDELPTVGITNSGLWVSWVGKTNTAQEQELYFVFEDYPNTNPDFPVITLVGASTINLSVGGIYNEQSATCVDLQDGQINGSVVIGGDTVNTGIAGIYNVEYDCQDLDLNNAITVTRVVIVTTVGETDAVVFGSPVEISEGAGSWYIADVRGFDNNGGMHWIYAGQVAETLWYKNSFNGEDNASIKLFDGTEFGGEYDPHPEHSIIFVDGQNVMIFSEFRSGGTPVNDAIAMVRSTNGGSSFSSPEIIMDYDQILYMNWEHSDAFVVKKSSDGDIFLLYGTTGSRNAGEWTGIFTKSTDGGVTWNDASDGSPTDGIIEGLAFQEPAHILDFVPAEFSIIIDGDTIHASFSAEDYDFGESGYYYNRSLDEGITWDTTDASTDRLYQLNDLQNDIMYEEEEWNYLFMNPDGDLISLWVDDENAESLNYVKSLDNGLTWTSETEVDTTICGDGQIHDDDYHTIDMRQIDDFIMYMCHDYAGNNVYAHYTSDFGETWTTNVLIENNPSASVDLFNINADVLGNNMAFAWDWFDDTLVEYSSSVFYAQSPTSVDNFVLQSGVTTEFTEYDSLSGELPSAELANNGIFYTYKTDANNVLWFVYATLVNANNPQVTLIGNNVINLSIGEEYVELGASCVDVEDGVLSVIISGDTVNTGIADVYIVEYNCQDTEFNNASTVTRTVNVELNAGIEFTLVDIICDGDTEIGYTDFVGFLEICPIIGASPPIITITGDVIVEVVIGDTYSDEGATAFDNGDGDLTSSISVIGVGNVNENVIGAYLIYYNVSDSLGNDAVEKVRTVLVVSQGTGGGGSGSGHSGTSVPLTVDEVGDTGVEGFTSEQQEAFNDALEQALIDAIGMTESTPLEQIIQTFFEFQVIDQTHSDLTLQSFIANQDLGIRWSTGDDIVISSIKPALSPFQFTFEQLPVVKTGSGGVVSSNGIRYNLEIPPNECSQTVSSNCVEKIRYNVPVTVNAVIDGIQVSATGDILIDLVEDAIDPIILILLATLAIPIIGGIIHKSRGGSNAVPVRRLVSN